MSLLVVKVLIISVLPPASSVRGLLAHFRVHFPGCSNPYAGASSRHAPIRAQALIPGMPLRGGGQGGRL